MLDKFKQMAQLKKLQDEAKSQRFEGESNGVKVVVNGTFSTEEVFLNSDLSIEDQANAVKAASNNAVQNAQRGMAAKFQDMM